MRVIVAETAGFCSGAQKAFNVIDSIETPSKCVFWGELLHSNEVRKAIESKGIELIEAHEKNLERVKGKIVYLPAHGVEKEIEKKIRELAEKVINNTCLSIIQIHKAVQEMDAHGRQVVVVGIRNHAETNGIISYTKYGVVVESPEELLDLIENKQISNNGIGVVAQTTADQDIFYSCLQILNDKYLGIQIFNTLCDCVSANQERTRNLAKNVDVMIILGGKNSVNTKALNRISSEYTKTYWVENLSEIREKWFEDAKVVGLSAGASTPNGLIDEARQLIEKM